MVLLLACPLYPQLQTNAETMTVPQDIIDNATEVLKICDDLIDARQLPDEYERGRDDIKDKIRPPTPFIRNVILDDYDTTYPWDAVYSPSDYFREHTSKNQAPGGFSEYGQCGRFAITEVRTKSFRSINGSYASHQATATNSIYNIAELPENVYVFAEMLISALQRLHEHQIKQTHPDDENWDTEDSDDDAGIFFSMSD